MADNALAKSLDLLRFALERKGVPQSQYFIQSGQEKPDLNDQWCLVQEKGGREWSVFYGERGSAGQHARFERYRDAIKYFFWVLTKPEDPWAFRPIWERTTGKEF